MPEISVQDLELCNELITNLVTLRLILKDTVKTEKILQLEIKNKLKKLEKEKIKELKILEEEIFIMTLRNKHLGRSRHIIKEEEIDLREQVKKKAGEIEELKEGVDGIEFQSFKTLEDLNILQHEEAAVVAKIEQKLIKSEISKQLINFFKKRLFHSKEILASSFRITAKKIHNA